MNNTLLRYLTAVVALPMVAVLILYASFAVFAAVVIAVFLMVAYEWFNLQNSAGYSVPVVYGLTLTIICIAGFVMHAYDSSGYYVLLSVYLSIAGSILYKILWHSSDLKQEAIALTGMVFAVLVAGISAGCLLLIYQFDGIVRGQTLLFIYLATVWVGDAAAMHVGKLLGRHPLSPLISPKKTIEGFLGAAVIGTGAGLIMNWIMKSPVPIWHLAVVGPALVSASHLGDLGASLFKRASGIKDSGKMIPGHGGFLDRLDNLLMTAPLVYLIAYALWR